jgi:thymidylate kinase
MSSFSSTTNKPLLATIEGNIGAGKSSIIAKMKERYTNRSDIVFVRLFFFATQK